MLLHWRPRSFVQAIAAAVAPVGGVLIQYPLYPGIVRMMTESGIATQMAHFFVAVSSVHTYPVMIGIYSAFLGLFIPSAGGKWLIEAPYMLEAAKTLNVHLGWVVQTYNATEALANLIHPFWMLPLVGILGLKARDIVGYSMLQFVVHVPLVLFLVWALNYTLQYVPPLCRRDPTKSFVTHEATSSTANFANSGRSTLCLCQRGVRRVRRGGLASSPAWSHEWPARMRRHQWREPRSQSRCLKAIDLS